jgi:hypothetical protein
MKFGQNLDQRPASSENREGRSEVLQKLMTSARNIDGLGGHTINEIFSSENENTRRGLIESLSDDQYLQFINGVNGILRGIEKDKWGMDGDGVTAASHEVVGTHIFPRHADKKDILTKTWRTAKEMNASGRNLEDIGMLLGSLLVEIHPYADGNGRTSRLIYSMVKDGISADKEEKLVALLGEDGRDELDMALSKFYINDLFEVKYGRLNENLNTYKIDGVFVDDKSTPFGKLTFPEGTNENVKENIIQAGRNDTSIFIAALFTFSQQHPDLGIESFTKIFGERKILLLQNLFFVLTKEQVEKLCEFYWGIKKKYTEDMIDIFSNPDKPEYKIQEGDKEIRMIDYFKQRIADKQVLF